MKVWMRAAHVTQKVALKFKVALILYLSCAGLLFSGKGNVPLPTARSAHRNQRRSSKRWCLPSSSFEFRSLLVWRILLHQSWRSSRVSVCRGKARFLGMGWAWCWIWCVFAVRGLRLDPASRKSLGSQTAILTDCRTHLIQKDIEPGNKTASDSGIAIEGFKALKHTRFGKEN